MASPETPPRPARAADPMRSAACPACRSTGRLSPAQRAADTRRRNKARALARIRARTAVQDRAVAVSPVAFVQAMLPHSDAYVLGPDGEPATVPTGRLGPDGEPEALRLHAPEYTATNGAFTLTVRAGTRRGPSHLHPRLSLGVPSGGLARYLLAHVVTEAKKRRSPVVPLGRTLADLCAALGITPSGGKNGRLRYVFDQLLRLATCSVAFQWEAGTCYGPRGREHYRGNQVLLIDAYDLWWERAEAAAAGRTADAPVERALGGTLTLGAQLWRLCQDGCFPLDRRKLAFFRDHPTAADLYGWLTHRLGTLASEGRDEVALNYDQLHAQLGSHYATDPAGRLTARGKKDFGYNLRKALGRVRLTWPALDVRTPRGRLVLRATEPDVPFRHGPS